MSEVEEPIQYAVRTSERANRDIDAAYVYYYDQFGESTANKWRNGVIKAISGLFFLPERYAPVPEEYFHGTVRHYTWQRAGSRLAHRILYRVETEGEDGPVVRVMHVRSAMLPPITLDEAREIEAQQ